ncbi:alpha-tocopherol transfer protein-like, partial [Stegodyphus dumicola]|uniref:alpha-tocopherol transfer protein-like n=1 Tax=Stegodyphus dumicola TaxID=202533 RepID=UPI0015A9471D
MTSKPLPFLLNGLTPELENKAFLELGETPKVKNDALEEMKRLIKENSNFEPFMEDIFLLSFLRWKKYRINEAFEALHDFYTLKKKHSRIYFDFTPSELTHVLKMNHLATQPLRGPGGCNVGILRLGYHDFKIGTFDELIATVLCMGLATNDIEAYLVSGAIIILDCKNVPLEILKTTLNPYRVYFIVEVMRCFPGRIRSIHVVNIPYFFDIFYNMVKSLLPKKILKR